MKSRSDKETKKEQIIQLYRSGYSQRLIIIKTHATPNYVKKIIRAISLMGDGRMSAPVQLDLQENETPQSEVIITRNSNILYTHRHQIIYIVKSVVKILGSLVVLLGVVFGFIQAWYSWRNSTAEVKVYLESTQEFAETPLNDKKENDTRITGRWIDGIYYPDELMIKEHTFILINPYNSPAILHRVWLEVIEKEPAYSYIFPQLSGAPITGLMEEYVEIKLDSKTTAVNIDLATQLLGPSDALRLHVKLTSIDFLRYKYVLKEEWKESTNGNINITSSEQVEISFPRVGWYSDLLATAKHTIEGTICSAPLYESQEISSSLRPGIIQKLNLGYSEPTAVVTDTSETSETPNKESTVTRRKFYTTDPKQLTSSFFRIFWTTQCEEEYLIIDRERVLVYEPYRAKKVKIYDAFFDAGIADLFSNRETVDKYIAKYESLWNRPIILPTNWKYSFLDYSEQELSIQHDILAQTILLNRASRETLQTASVSPDDESRMLAIYGLSRGDPNDYLQLFTKLAIYDPSIEVRGFAKSLLNDALNVDDKKRIDTIYKDYSLLIRPLGMDEADRIIELLPDNEIKGIALNQNWSETLRAAAIKQLKADAFNSTELFAHTLIELATNETSTPIRDAALQNRTMSDQPQLIAQFANSEFISLISNFLLYNDSAVISKYSLIDILLHIDAQLSKFPLIQFISMTDDDEIADYTFDRLKDEIDHEVLSTQLIQVLLLAKDDHLRLRIFDYITSLKEDSSIGDLLEVKDQEKENPIKEQMDLLLGTMNEPDSKQRLVSRICDITNDDLWIPTSYNTPYDIVTAPIWKLAMRLSKDESINRIMRCALNRGLYDWNTNSRETAMQLLAELDPGIEIFQELLELIKSSDPIEKQNIIRMISIILERQPKYIDSYPETKVIVRSILNNRNENVDIREEAFELLYLLSQPYSFSVVDIPSWILLDLGLQHGNSENTPYKLTAAISTLSTIEIQEGLQALQEMLPDRRIPKPIQWSTLLTSYQLVDLACDTNTPAEYRKEILTFLNPESQGHIALSIDQEARLLSANTIPDGAKIIILNNWIPNAHELLRRFVYQSLQSTSPDNVENKKGTYILDSFKMRLNITDGDYLVSEITRLNKFVDPDLYNKYLELVIALTRNLDADYLHTQISTQKDFDIGLLGALVLIGGDQETDKLVENINDIPFQRNLAFAQVVFDKGNFDNINNYLWVEDEEVNTMAIWSLAYSPKGEGILTLIKYLYQNSENHDVGVNAQTALYCAIGNSSLPKITYDVETLMIDNHTSEGMEIVILITIVYFIRLRNKKASISRK